jgi:hypothetical protein
LGYKSLIGEGRYGVVDNAVYATAPVVATDTRWPLAPPGLFITVEFRSVAQAAIIEPGSNLVVPGVEATRVDSYSFYVSPISATLRNSGSGDADSGNGSSGFSLAS